MCGVVGILGSSSVAPLLLAALKRLEYRGYDSAGIATIESQKINRCRAEGKLINLEKSLKKNFLPGCIGIGHTRWATHGVANERNAHPHLSENFAVVHNGVIENFKELKDKLLSLGYHFYSETDTEVVVYLLEESLKKTNNPAALAFDISQQLKGSFSLAILFKQNEDLIIAVRNGSPLALGYGKKEVFVGSDPSAFLDRVYSVVYLEDGDCVVLSRKESSIYDRTGKKVVREASLPVSYASIHKGSYKHFMIKEIYDQPDIITKTISHYIDRDQKKIKKIPFDFASLERALFSACGTAYFASLISKYWFEMYARLPIDVDVASEFRYREPPLPKNAVAFFISQSGETADTLAALRYCRTQLLKIVSIVNAEESSMARESDVIFPVLAGLEIGVASTKAFTCQLLVMAILTIDAGVKRGVLSLEQEKKLIEAICEVPVFMQKILDLYHPIQKIAQILSMHKSVLYLGRGINYPLALEGALKLKEISYIHAEGYAAGELKHGPIALIDETVPVIFIAPFDRMFEKILLSIQEVSARGGKIILLTDARGAQACTLDTVATVILPEVPEFITPIIYAIPIQMIAYFTAIALGTDVDQPRNLAKSVTVE